MKCPRCGKENPVPEATNHLCHNCGFNLIGEVTKHDVHELAARRSLFKFFFIVIILGGIGYSGYRTNWFGIIANPFVASERPDITATPAADDIQFAATSSTITLHPQSAFRLNALVLANQRYADGTLDVLSNRDLIVGWGSIATGSRKRIEVTLHDRTASLLSPDGQIDGKTLLSLSATLHVIPATDNIKRILENLQGGAKITIEGSLVEATIDNTHFAAVQIGSGEGEPTQFLLYVISVVLQGKLFGLNFSL